MQESCGRVEGTCGRGPEQRLASVALLTGGSRAESPRKQLSLSLLPGTPAINYRLNEYLVKAKQVRMPHTRVRVNPQYGYTVRMEPYAASWSYVYT